MNSWALRWAYNNQNSVSLNSYPRPLGGGTGPEPSWKHSALPRKHDPPVYVYLCARQHCRTCCGPREQTLLHAERASEAGKNFKHCYTNLQANIIGSARKSL